MKVQSTVKSAHEVLPGTTNLDTEESKTMGTAKFKEAIENGDYEAQGQEFLDMTDTELKIDHITRGKYWEDDTEDRDIFMIHLIRGSRSYSFKYGGSIKDCKDGEFLQSMGSHLTSKERYRKRAFTEIKTGKGFYYLVKFPNAYDTLACLTKDDPGTFEDFCGNFGYETDSRKAENIYKAIVDEYKGLAMLFNDEELEFMAEIN